MSYHEAVLLGQSVVALVRDKSGVYVDVTFGAGGHSKEILKSLNDKGRLIGFDQDSDAIANKLKDERFLFVKSNFAYLGSFLEYHGIQMVDGLIADLGVSSHQIDKADRGFSFRFDAKLDMRMNQLGARTAANVLNQYGLHDLQRIFSDYGELRNARSFASSVVSIREQRPFLEIKDLLLLIDKKCIGNKQKYIAQVFQAIRIEVNDEMYVLEKMLTQAKGFLKSGGRLVVITYHSLEDRIVKRFMKTGNVRGELNKDDFGKVINDLKLINKKIIVPDEEEVRFNNRARSAKLRIAEKM